MQLVINKNFIGLNLIKIFCIICFFSGILSYLSYFFDNEYIKIWKEIYIIIICVCFFNYHLKLINIKTFFFMLFTGVFFFVEFLYSILLDVPINIIVYQLKNDLLLYLFTSYLYLFFIKIDDEKMVSFVKTLIKIIIYLGAVNAISMILETIFFEQFLNLVGLDMGNWGTAVGVKIVTVSGGYMRPIGLQSGFVQASTLIILSFILLNESKIYTLKNKKIKYFLEMIFIIAIILSTYATAIIGLLMYLFIKFTKKMLKINIIPILSLFLFMFFLYTSHGLGIYELAYELYPDKADTSILFRVIQHWEIIDSISQNIISLFLGIGLGVNGTFGLDKELYGIMATATDSTYIYLLSNYGIMGAVFYIISLVYLMINFYRTDFLGIEYCLFYILIIDFFFNNTITNFPFNFIILLLIVLSFRLKNIYEIKNTDK